jgi:glucose-1-phosphate thymidylyltransferase
MVEKIKGIILAGGKGTRLEPATKVVNKHLIIAYDRPMIEYPLNTLASAGIKDILIVTGREHIGNMIEYLGSGAERNLRFTYKVQDEAGGIAQALGIAKEFIGDDNCAVILGDNLFLDDISQHVNSFKKGAKIFIKQVPDPHRFGVAELLGNKVKSIEEKPKLPKSNYAVTGLYLYDNRVFDIISKLKPSNRGELEITDVNNEYIKLGELTAINLKKEWTDMGTPESLLKAAHLLRNNNI